MSDAQLGGAPASTDRRERGSRPPSPPHQSTRSDRRRGGCTDLEVRRARSASCSGGRRVRRLARRRVAATATGRRSVVEFDDDRLRLPAEQRLCDGTRFAFARVGRHRGASTISRQRPSRGPFDVQRGPWTPTCRSSGAWSSGRSPAARRRDDERRASSTSRTAALDGRAPGTSRGWAAGASC